MIGLSVPKPSVVTVKASVDADGIDTAWDEIDGRCPDPKESPRHCHLRRRKTTGTKGSLYRQVYLHLKGKSYDRVPKERPFRSEI